MLRGPLGVHQNKTNTQPLFLLCSAIVDKYQVSQLSQQMMLLAVSLLAGGESGWAT
jgi:hypothetical protein